MVMTIETAVFVVVLWSEIDQRQGSYLSITFLKHHQANETVEEYLNF